MDFLHNPVILFFCFGVFAASMRSNLEIPPQIAKFLSLYLLMAIGLKGGLALNHTGITPDVWMALSLAVGMAIVVPLVNYLWLRTQLSGFDAAAVAATYGSISAVTFVTASQYLDTIGMGHNDYMSAAMALMESPAIIIGIWLANRHRQTGNYVNNGQGVLVEKSPVGMAGVLRDSFVEGANLLLLASMGIGLLIGNSGYAMMKPLTGDLFSGLLAFFLLDMGIQVARNLPGVRGMSVALLVYAVVAPLCHAVVVLAACWWLEVEVSNTVLLMVLSASASYIAVPAALRESLPEANPSVYLGLSLGITFPFNVILGIPLYYWMASQVM